MLQAFANASAWLAEKTGVEGAMGYAVVVGLAVVGHFVMNHIDNQRYEAAAAAKKAEEEEAEALHKQSISQFNQGHCGLRPSRNSPKLRE